MDRYVKLERKIHKWRRKVTLTVIKRRVTADGRRMKERISKGKTDNKRNNTIIQ